MESRKRHDSHMRWFFLTVIFILLPHGILSAQTPPVETEPERSLNSLKTIAVPLDAAVAELQKLGNELDQAASQDAKQEIQKRIDAERERIRQLRENFRSILGGSEAAEYDGASPEGATIQDQISELIQPVLSEIREATSEPRELDALRKSLKKWEDRKAKTDVVLARIDEITAAAKDKALLPELESARRLWTSRQAEASSQIAVISVQIDRRTSEKRPLWETVSGGLSSFFRSRGMNLLFAVLAAALGFFATRKIYAWIRRVSPVHKKDKNNFTSRISDVLALTIAILISIAGVVFVFYARGDWLLLTLVVIFLIGIVWAGKTAIPPYLEQIRMILNLSSVREGERVIYQGLPWKVAQLGFFTTFTNPSLQGGTIRIPIKDVMGMISRPVEPRDVWFPSEPDEWVILSDGMYGKVVVQTPDQVVVLALGGSKKTYPTSDFLELTPENLSHGFRISVTFGIDYSHQAESTTSIPEIFEAALTSDLISRFGRDAVRSIKVEFASASASSLDYMVLADFDGSMALKKNPLERRIQAVCVETCNEHGWIIPFAQLTVHQAES